MKTITSPYLNLLRNHIDITHVPFSDRGSRLLVFQEPGQSWLLVKSEGTPLLPVAPQTASTNMMNVSRWEPFARSG